MVDFAQTMADFTKFQIARAAQASTEIDFLKQAVLVPLRAAGIVRVEVRFDGFGDSGAVEGCDCFDAANANVACPEAGIDPFDFEVACDHICIAPTTVARALDALTYLALERHHSGWEINEGSYGALVIDVAAGSFMLDCSQRFISTEEYSDEL